jgi:hypothetical protein
MQTGKYQNEKTNKLIRGKLKNLEKILGIKISKRNN